MRLALLPLLPWVVTCVVACEPAQTPEGGAGGRAEGEAVSADGGRGRGADGGGAGASGAHPFAGSTAEATSVISGVVDQRQSEIGSCIREFRARKKMTHDRVAISFGIDQEGKLLGVTSKGKEDADLQTCIQEALRGAAFPRSHSGVITVTKTYEELVL